MTSFTFSTFALFVYITYTNSLSWKSVSFFKTALMNFPKLLIFFSLAFFSRCFLKSLLKSILNFMPQK